MEFVADLWLAILIATVVLWFMSFIAWAILPHHFADRRKVDDEEGLMAYIREANIGPGNYFFPYVASSKQQGTPEYLEKYSNGPRGTLNVYAMPNMGKNMALTIVYFFITVFTIAYLGSVACPAGTDFVTVFRITGTVGVLTYASSGALNRIWFVERMWTHIVDGVVYGVALGLIFAFFWPSA
ncbi:MAG: hypothetical protein AAF939_05080 [Planctomycetota bacterium]